MLFVSFDVNGVAALSEHLLLPIVLHCEGTKCLLRKSHSHVSIYKCTTVGKHERKKTLIDCNQLKANNLLFK